MNCFKYEKSYLIAHKLCIEQLLKSLYLWCSCVIILSFDGSNALFMHSLLKYETVFSSCLVLHIPVDHALNSVKLNIFKLQLKDLRRKPE